VNGRPVGIFGLAAGEQFDPSTYSARSWAARAYLVLAGSVLAFSAYVWLLQSASVSLVATYAYVNPLVAVTLGWLIIAEPVTVPTVVGGAVVVLGVAVVVGAELPAQTRRPARPTSTNPVR
jgi:drug/metabolite transporter (DMT)-like permease